jgi:hypothetical protein
MALSSVPGLIRPKATMLKRLGYRVLTPKSPSEGIFLAAEYGPRIQLLITDVIAHWGVQNEGVHFIQKPFVLKDLSS